MGNKQNQAKPNQQPVKTQQQIQQQKQQKAGCGGCFGGKRPSKSSNPNNNQSRSHLDRTRTIHKANKSQITVLKNPDVKIDQNLFQGRKKQLIDIRLNRKQPYQILKDSDYFDSELDDKNQLNTLAKAYETCEIANYKTPEMEKLQTVRVKTYLFDRNLTKIAV